MYGQAYPLTQYNCRNEMRCQRIANGFPLRINVSLLSLSIVFAVVASLCDRGNLGTICLGTGALLTLVAVGPSSFWFLWERVRKRKGKYEDPDTIVPGWKRFCQSMGIEKAIQVRSLTNLRNAFAKGSTINIGQPVLESLDSVSLKGVFAHELAHIKGNHTLKGKCLLMGVVLASGVLFQGVLYGFGPSGSTAFACATQSIMVIGFAGIAMRFVLWPFEYSADSMADQCVKQGAVASALKAIATLRKMDVAHDFYGHPSVNKRIANLGKSQKGKFRRWHIEL
jgi:Zn-dependent protease with chaperone function